MYPFVKLFHVTTQFNLHFTFVAVLNDLTVNAGRKKKEQAGELGESVSSRGRECVGHSGRWQYLAVWGAPHLKRRRRESGEGSGSLIAPGGDSGGSPHLKHNRDTWRGAGDH